MPLESLQLVHAMITESGKGASNNFSTAQHQQPNILQSTQNIIKIRVMKYPAEYWILWMGKKMSEVRWAFLPWRCKGSRAAKSAGEWRVRCAGSGRSSTIAYDELAFHLFISALPLSLLKWRHPCPAVWKRIIPCEPWKANTDSRSSGRSICFLPRPTQAKFQRVVSRGNERGNNKLLSCCPIAVRTNWLARLRRMSPTDQSTFSPKRSPMPLRLTAHYFKFFIGMPVR